MPVRGGMTSFAYHLTAGGLVKIMILNERADKVAEYEEFKGAGLQTSQLNLSGLATGLYFYVIHAEDGTRLKGKIMVVRP